MLANKVELMADSDEITEPQIIPVQHDTPISDPTKLKFNFLANDEKNLEDGEFKILPVESHSNGFSYVLQFVDSMEQVPCYILSGEVNPFGWCRCESFGERGVCRHLFAVYKWKQGMVQAENQEIALEALQRLREDDEDTRPIEN